MTNKATFSFSREQLIEICEQSIVPCKEWGDRDSYAAEELLEKDEKRKPYEDDRR